MIDFQVNKNIVLLYALLNRFGQAYGETTSTSLRGDMIEFFKDYDGKKPNSDKYTHPSKGVFWSLMVSEIPEFKTKEIKLNEQNEWGFKLGSYLKPYLLNFYNNTNFEEYYEKVLPKLENIKNKFKQSFKNKGIEKVLEETWGVSIKEQMIVIPNPFSEGSFGPQIGDINYQIIGMWDNRKFSSYSHNIIHEGSHPLAKEVQKPYKSLINSKKHLLKEVMKHPNYKGYKPWYSCFEEHLIRAVQRGLIAPKLDSDYPVKKGLQFELENSGMIFIQEFYDVLVKSKSVGEAIPSIVDNLA